MAQEAKSGSLKMDYIALEEIGILLNNKEKNKKLLEIYEIFFWIFSTIMLFAFWIFLLLT